MSTQPSFHDVQLTILNAQQNFRLLELPGELLDLLTAPNPPKLYFKSSSPKPSTSTSNNGGPSSSLSKTVSLSHLHLCTPTQTYQARQVSTSNSVYVLKPSASPHSVPTDQNGNSSTLEPHSGATTKGMTAISTIDTMLELLPVTHDIKSLLQNLLPVYDLTSSSSFLEEDKISHFLSITSPNSKSAIFSDIPAPSSQIETSWRDILAFEYRSRCARPGPGVCLASWKSILDHATLEMRDLASDSGVDFETFFAQGHEQDEPITIDKAIANAILKFLDPDWEMRRDGVVRKVEISADWHAHSGERRQRLDRAKTVQWMGMILLQVLSQKVDSASVGVGVGMEDFLSQWSDLLPEKWRGDVGLDRLGDGYYTIAREGLIMWVGEEAGLSVAEKDGLGAVNANATATAAVTGGKRKWHEKFKAQRKETRK